MADQAGARAEADRRAAAGAGRGPRKCEAEQGRGRGLVSSGSLHTWGYFRALFSRGARVENRVPCNVWKWAVSGGNQAVRQAAKHSDSGRSLGSSAD